MNIGNPREALERLHLSYDALKANELFQDILKECVLRGRSFHDEAGRLATDRDMNRMHGKADAYASMPEMVGDVVDALDKLLNDMIEREAVEDGRTDTEGDRGESGSRSHPAAAEIPKRKSDFAHVLNKQD